MVHPSVRQNSVDIDFGEVLGSTVVASYFVVAADDGFVEACTGFVVA